MKRRELFAAALAAGMPALAAAAAPALPPVQVWKSPTCGCCGAWVTHMRQAGFAVEVHEVQDIDASRRLLGMPATYGSCHTARVAGYLLEGHVPAAEVRRLLAMKPVAIGLAVPGMPAGSPGMEMGARRDAYEVLLVEKGGGARVFARYNGG
uniref:CopJ n=1 Tax=Rubrivivax gelatinosus S1 TaxID=1138313 RepID=W8FKW0_RUBGE|nr:CopJ [Rubrivivax gelatinosus S1]